MCSHTGCKIQSNIVCKNKCVLSEVETELKSIPDVWIKYFHPLYNSEIYI